MATIIIIGVVIIGITLGLGLWSYWLRKRTQTNLVDVIIPVAYFAVRAILAVMIQTTTHGLVSSLVGGLYSVWLTMVYLLGGSAWLISNVD